MKHIKRVLFVAFMLIVGVNCCAFAQTYTTGKTSTTTENPVINFNEEGIIWTGALSDDWSNAGNWKGNKTPAAGDYVFIPSGLSRYPKITTPASVHAIYFAPGASLEGQHLLTANEWYTTVNIPTNCWVSLCPQLQKTMSGDFFTAEQGGVYNGPFDPSHYTNTKEGTDGPNRTFPYSIYQRVFTSMVKSLTAANYYIYDYENGWSVPTNALGTEYPVGQGIQIWAPSAKGNTTSFHFPSDATTYVWYDKKGYIVTPLGEVSVSHSSQPAFRSVDSEGIMTATINVMFKANLPLCSL